MNNPWCDDPLSLQKPKAVLGTTSNLPSLSPWAADDDDGFGDWATTAGSTPWADAGVQASQLVPGGDSPGKGSPIAWPSSTATSPGLRPLRSRASSVFRQPSPDPWSKDSPWSDFAEDLTPVPSKAHVLTADDKYAEEPATSNGPIIQVDEPETVHETQFGSLDEGGIKRELQEKSDTTSPLKSQFESNETSADSVSGPELHGSPSRPSSTFSVESEHGVDRQDSPITSIDEEPKSRPQCASGRVSGKVIKLVGLYDGLSRSASEEPSELDRRAAIDNNSQRTCSAQSRKFDEDEEEAEFGDFGDTAPADQDSLKESVASVTSDRSSTPNATKDDLKPQSDVGATQHGNTVTNETSKAVENLVEKFGASHFAVDLTTLEKLYPEVEELTNDSDNHDDIDVSDRIIVDNFTTIGERKTWYRISRYGSMRKHNLGDDENYVRVSWKTSQLHIDTIKIVRRWMEEDSFSGKATLGGMKRESIFNWDSSAAPVELDKVFPRKFPGAHSRSSSIITPGHVHSSSMGSLAGALGQRKASGGSVSSRGPISIHTASAVASFGWSSNPVESPVTFHNNLTNDSKLGMAPKPPYSQDESITISALPPAPKSDTIPPPQPPTLETQASDDNDDDWGEMISPVQEVSVVDDGFFGSEDSAKKPLKSSTDVGVDQQVFDWHEAPGITKPTMNIQSSIGTPKPAMNNQLNAPSTAAVHNSAVPITSMSAPIPDPWAFADFSVFEAPPPTPQPFTMASPSGKSTFHESTHMHTSTPSIHTPITTTNTVVAANITLGPLQSSREEEEQARLVQQILQNLPDLSYILK